MLLLSDDKPLSASAYSPVFEVLSKPAVTLSESDLISSESELLNAFISPACLLFSDMPFSISSTMCLSLSEKRLSLSVIKPSISSAWCEIQPISSPDIPADFSDISLLSFSPIHSFCFFRFSISNFISLSFDAVDSPNLTWLSSNVRNDWRHSFICSALSRHISVQVFRLFSRKPSISQSCAKCSLSVCLISLLSFIVLLRDIGNNLPKNPASLSDNLPIISKSSREHCCCSTFSQAVLFLLQYPCTARSLYAYMP